MGLEIAALTVATSRADDAAFLALEDVAALTAEIADARVVGGHMAGLLLTAFPVPGTILRRTADADAAVATQVAAGGDLHKALKADGYRDTAGNHYVKDGATAPEAMREIDLLVPSGSHMFHTDVLGGRAFDAAPGLSLALAATPVVVNVDVTLTSGQRRELSVRVPPVEIAVVLKALATRTRGEPKDYTDIFNLLSIAYQYRDQPDLIGGWRLDGPTIGARRDAASVLHRIADNAARNHLLDDAGVPRQRLVALVRTLVVGR